MRRTYQSLGLTTHQAPRCIDNAFCVIQKIPENMHALYWRCPAQGHWQSPTLNKVGNISKTVQDRNAVTHHQSELVGDVAVPVSVRQAVLF